MFDKKILCTPFWYCRGILFIDFQGGNKARMNSKKYVAIMEDLKKKIKRKCSGPLSSGVFLHHDSATPYRSKTTTAKIAAFGWSIFSHATNSPDLAPSDYHLFPKLKQFLGDKRFANERQLTAIVLKWFQTVETQFYTDEMNKLLLHYQKCIYRNGDYVEK